MAVFAKDSVNTPNKLSLDDLRKAVGMMGHAIGSPLYCTPEQLYSLLFLRFKRDPEARPGRNTEESCAILQSRLSGLEHRIAELGLDIPGSEIYLLLKITDCDDWWIDTFEQLKVLLRHATDLNLYPEVISLLSRMLLGYYRALESLYAGGTGAVGRHSWTTIKNEIERSGIVEFLKDNCPATFSAQHQGTMNDINAILNVALVVGELEEHVPWSTVCKEIPFNGAEMVVDATGKPVVNSDQGEMYPMAFTISVLWESLHLSTVE